MNRRITKTIAEEAAAKIKVKAFQHKIDNATARVNAAVEELVKRYIPAPVIACVNEYSNYFSYSWGASITTIIDKGDWTTTRGSIKGKLSFKIPLSSNCIKVSNGEYDALMRLQSNLDKLVIERDYFGNNVCAALVALRTEKNVEKEFPEAMKYLTFPKVKSVPMPVFTGLRDIIGKIKDE